MYMPRQTVRDVRKINRTTVLQAIYFNNQISRLEVSQRTGLSPATVTNVVGELLEEGIITEQGFEESRGGRPRTILTVNPHYGYFMGIDVGETHIHAELFDLRLNKLEQTRYLLDARETQIDQVLSYITKSIESLLAHVPADKVVGVGIGFPGIVDPNEGISVFAPNWGWRNIDLLKMLQANFSFPLYLNNGAQAMALAERWFGAGVGVDNLAVLLIGTGVGAGIIAQGELYHGVSNSAGEWGHTCIELDGRTCRCGSSGCVEAYVGAPGIIAQVRELDPNSKLLRFEDQVATITAIRDAAQAGDAVAAKVMNQTAQYMGAGIANVINLFNPELIVLGGWSALLWGEQLLPEIYRVAEHYAMKQPFKAVRINLSKLGEDAISLGAASLALESFLKASLG